MNFVARIRFDAPRSGSTRKKILESIESTYKHVSSDQLPPGASDGVVEDEAPEGVDESQFRACHR